MANRKPEAVEKKEGCDWKFWCGFGLSILLIIGLCTAFFMWCFNKLFKTDPSLVVVGFESGELVDNVFDFEGKYEDISIICTKEKCMNVVIRDCYFFSGSKLYVDQDNIEISNLNVKGEFVYHEWNKSCTKYKKEIIFIEVAGVYTGRVHNESFYEKCTENALNKTSGMVDSILLRYCNEEDTKYNKTEEKEVCIEEGINCADIPIRIDLTDRAMLEKYSNKTFVCDTELIGNVINVNTSSCLVQGEYEKQCEYYRDV